MEKRPFLWASMPTTIWGWRYNALTAAECGADYIDVTCRGAWRGRRECPGRGGGRGYSSGWATLTGLDFYSYMDLAENVVEPTAPGRRSSRARRSCWAMRACIPAFCRIPTVPQKIHLNPLDILVELGRRGMVGGQEDMIIDVAHALSGENRVLNLSKGQWQNRIEKGETSI